MIYEYAKMGMDRLSYGIGVLFQPEFTPNQQLAQMLRKHHSSGANIHDIGRIVHGFFQDIGYLPHSVSDFHLITFLFQPHINLTNYP